MMRLTSIQLLLINLLHIWPFSFSSAELNELNQEIYDFDTSWAIRGKKLSDQLGNKQAVYDSFIEGCHAGSKSLQKATVQCDFGDDTRIEMNNLQPMSMRNYTQLGFSRIRARTQTFQLLKDFWDANRHKNETEWHSVNTYHNMWESPSSIIDIQDESKGGGYDLRSAVWESARQTVDVETFQIQPNVKVLSCYLLKPLDY